MRRIALVLALAFAAPLAVPVAAAADTSSLAPADRYFGRMQMSVLGIRNRLHDLAQRLDANPGEGEAVFHYAVLVEDAVRAWQTQYPHDTWLPRTQVALARLYARTRTVEGRAASASVFAWIAASHPDAADLLQR